MSFFIVSFFRNLTEVLFRLTAAERGATPWLRGGILLVMSLGCYAYVTQDLARVYHFWGDQGTTALLLRKIHDTGELPLLGPRAGFGGRYFGPAYYVLLYPAYYLSGFSPLAGGYFTAGLNLVAVALLLNYISVRTGQIVLPNICLLAYSLQGS